MAKDELILSKKDFDRFIRLNYEPDDGTGDKGFFDILMGPRKYLHGRRDFAGSNVAGDTLQYLLDKIRNKVELSFSEKLIELIKEKGKKPSDIYKKAEINKDLFAKIKGNKNYHPTKDTAVAFAIALHLNLDETENLIGRAGYTLSNSIKRDLIIRCYIEAKVFNIGEINRKMEEYGYSPLTGKQYV